MLRSLIVLGAVMNVNFLKLISVGCEGWRKLSITQCRISLTITTNLEDRPICSHAALYLYLHETPMIARCCEAFPWPKQEKEASNMSIVIIFNCLIRIVICILLTTLCLSMCSGLKYGSNSNLSGSMLMGDWRRPLLHMFHTGFMRPQKPDKVDWIVFLSSS